MWIKYKNKYVQTFFSLVLNQGKEISHGQYVIHSITYCLGSVRMFQSVAGTSELQNSVKLPEMKLALCVSDHVPERHKTREGLDHSGMKTSIKKTLKSNQRQSPNDEI